MGGAAGPPGQIGESARQGQRVCANDRLLVIVTSVSGASSKLWAGRRTASRCYRDSFHADERLSSRLGSADEVGRSC